MVLVGDVLCQKCVVHCLHGFPSQSINPTMREPGHQGGGGSFLLLFYNYFHSDTPLQPCVPLGWSLVGPKRRILCILAVSKASFFTTELISIVSQCVKTQFNAFCCVVGAVWVCFTIPAQTMSAIQSLHQPPLNPDTVLLMITDAHCLPHCIRVGPLNCCLSLMFLSALTAIMHASPTKIKNTIWRTRVDDTRSCNNNMSIIP